MTTIYIPEWIMLIFVGLILVNCILSAIELYYIRKVRRLTEQNKEGPWT